jgi:hypothetical protein
MNSHIAPPCVQKIVARMAVEIYTILSRNGIYPWRSNIFYALLGSISGPETIMPFDNEDGT